MVRYTETHRDSQQLTTDNRQPTIIYPSQNTLIQLLNNYLVFFPKKVCFCNNYIPTFAAAFDASSFRETKQNTLIIC
jgi:hypothetical protein